MLFNSFQFLVFFPVVTVLFFALPYRFRWALILGASCYFYMAFIPHYILILGVTIVIDYFGGILIERYPRRKKFYLVLSVVSTTAVLFLFKYYNFFTDNVAALADSMGLYYPLSASSLALPIGLSFHTFQSLSYVIEVYRGNQKAEKHFGIYSVYVMFYPQLVAGPIERPQNLLGQFRQKFDFDYDRVTDGLKQMGWGMFKKVVIADRLALFVDPIYANPEGVSGQALLIATLFFTFQIYCDFSGYSDIAIGAAKVMGFRLMTNFDRPYFSESIVEFWRRWHISLSTWFRDYVYYPMGGNRVPALRHSFNLLVVFLISGLWHGANWTFLAWGLLHGVALVLVIRTSGITGRFQDLIRKWVPFIPLRTIKIVITFLFVMVAWVFFRAESVTDAFYIIGNFHKFNNEQGFFGIPVTAQLYYAFASIVLLMVIEKVQAGGKIIERIKSWPVAFRWALYYAIVGGILFFGEFGNQQFIYFQF